jgi:hypothetical protein
MPSNLAQECRSTHLPKSRCCGCKNAHLPRRSSASKPCSLPRMRLPERLPESIRETAAHALLERMVALWESIRHRFNRPMIGMRDQPPRQLAGDWPAQCGKTWRKTARPRDRSAAEHR